MFLSFIIPLYNCEKYIASCLDTILGSKLFDKDYEIIIVNDESKDQGPEIVQEYSKKHSNIHLYTQENDGPATARNTGLDHAKGDYIWFVDADDLIEPLFISQILKTVKEQPDIDLISFAYTEQYPDKDIVHKKVETPRVCNGLEYLSSHSGGYLWNNIYSRKSIGNHRFINGVRHIEDYCFNISTIINFEKVIMLPDVGYYYNRKNIHSISHDKRLRDRIRANNDSYIVYKAIHQLMSQTVNEKKKAFLDKELNFSIAAHLYTMLRFDNARTIKRYIAEYRRMGLYPLEKTGNRKSDWFLLLANHEHLLLWIAKAYSLYKKMIVKRHI